MAPKTILFVGVGYIGGSVLTRLLNDPKYNREQYEFAAFTRKDEQAKKLRELGVRPIKGSLDDLDLLKTEASKADIIINTANCDDEKAAGALLDGIKSRKDTKEPVVYVHTSGTGVLTDGSGGQSTSKKVYSDSKSDDVDSVSDNAPHRPVDLLIKRFTESSTSTSLNTRVGIILPCLIHGIGTGPFNQVSQQVPALIRLSLDRGRVGVYGPGKNVWSTVHIRDLVEVYALVLDNLVNNKEGTGTTSGGDQNLYWFAQTSEVIYEDIAERTAQILTKLGKLETPAEGKPLFDSLDIDELEKYGWPRASSPQWGGNSRSSADRARRLGWTKKEDTESALESLPLEIDAVIKQR